MSIHDGMFAAYLDDMRTITILIPYGYRKENIPAFSLHYEGQPMADLSIQSIIRMEQFTKYTCQTPYPLTLGEEYQVEDDRGKVFGVHIGAVIRTEEFEEAYYYDGADLGAYYTKGKTVFKVWAPTATRMKVKVLNSFGAEKGSVSMHRGERGVWSITIHDDLEGCYYSYLIRVNDVWREAVDPYTKALSANGRFGAIVDFDYIGDKESYVLPDLESPVDAIIYETHIRDFSIHPNSGMVSKGKYTAFSEKDTKTANGYSTGIDYLKQLGVTHLELLPFNDYYGVDENAPDQEYNWGYNPLHFNAPEGSYSSSPQDPYARIIELKQLISSCHQRGLRVLMDVVYNHVYRQELSSLERIVPGYYFRYDRHGIPSNGSGCGNDIATERRMVRKFILDSVRFWLESYDLDGFRFDLMGLLDVETMRQIESMVHAIKPSALLIGEGWDLDTPLTVSGKTIIANAQQVPNTGFFNDRFRDGIKGSTFNLKDTGYVTGKNISSTDFFDLFTKAGGHIPLMPTQSVNYVECHDNHTLWDRLTLAKGESVDIRQKRHRLATSIVLLAQGIPFLHSGQEFFRSKDGVENSYCSPDEINMLNWDQREHYDENVQYIRGLIQLRKSHGAFRLRTETEIDRHCRLVDLKQSCIAILYEDIKDYGNWTKIFMVFHHGESPSTITLPKGQWATVCSHASAGTGVIEYVQNNEYKLEPLSTYVFVQG